MQHFYRIALFGLLFSRNGIVCAVFDAGWAIIVEMTGIDQPSNCEFHDASWKKSTGSLGGDPVL